MAKVHIGVFPESYLVAAIDVTPDCLTESEFRSSRIEIGENF